MSASEAGVAEQVKKLSVNDSSNDAVKPNKKENKKSKQQSLYLDPEPTFIEERIEMFDRLQKEYNDKVASMPRVPLKIVLKDGAVKEATSWETTPMDIAKGISKSLADRLCISKINGQLWDLDRPFEGEANEEIKLELLDFESDEGKKVFGIRLPTSWVNLVSAT